jgi:hypothetical protein
VFYEGNGRVGTTCGGGDVESRRPGMLGQILIGDQTVRQRLANLRPTANGMRLKECDERDSVPCMTPPIEKRQKTDPGPPLPSPLPVTTPTNFHSQRSPVTDGHHWQPPAGRNLPPLPSRPQQQQQSATRESTVVR